MRIIITIALTIISFAKMMSQESSNLSQDSEINFKKLNLNYQIKPTSVNTPKNEIAVGFFKNKFLILSDKKYFHNKIHTDKVTNTEIPKTLCADIYYDKDIKNPNLFSKLLDSNLNEGHIVFNKDNNVAYLTRKKDENSRDFYLFKSELVDENKGIWSDAEEVLIDGKSISMITPRVSADSKSMYFSAKIDQGIGGFDIYKADFKNNSELVNLNNLGPTVNSTNDEISPIEFEDYIYFASNIPEGKGGFDLYRVFKNNSNSTKYNLGDKINSPRDEINIIPTSKSEGYFTSNKGENFLDIFRYQLTISKQTLETTFVDESKKEIPKLFVEVFNDENVLVHSGVTNSRGKINFATEPGTKLNFKISTTIYNKTTPLTYTTLEDVDNDFNTFTLLPIPKPVVTKVVEDIKDEPFVLDHLYNVQFDFDKFDVKDSESFKINRIIELLKKHPEASITLHGHTDRKGTEKYNLKLSKRRVETVKLLLEKNGIDPARLYTVAHGKSNLLENCKECTPLQDSLNRRVEFVVNKH